jgi:DeoR family transcriptional regulator, catabolite repression regulator
MRFVMTHLEFHEIGTVDDFVWPEEVTGISIESPAMLFFTDFEKVKPLVVDLSTRADLARSLMLREHVKLKLVVDSDDKFLGVVSLDDISEQHITAKLSKTITRDSITVADLMVPKREIKGLDFSEVESVDIGTVVHHLKDIGQQHCLVLDKSLNKIRGIFSASDISRKLGLPINVQDHSNFYRVFSALTS